MQLLFGAVVSLCDPVQLQAIWDGCTKPYARPLTMTGFSCILIGRLFSGEAWRPRKDGQGMGSNAKKTGSAGLLVFARDWVRNGTPNANRLMID